MLRFLPKMYGAQIKTLVFSCSLILLVASTGFAQTSKPKNDSKTQEQLRELKREAQAMLNGTPPLQGVSEKAKQIRSSAIYHEPTPSKKGTNWLGKAFERIKDLFRRSPRRDPESDLKFGDLSGISDIFVWLMYTVFAIGFILFAYFVFRQIEMRKKLKRAAALLEEEEPVRSYDEWLILAEQMEREGDIRGAVRAYYLSILLFMDDHNILRFNRKQTNWEHLSRFQSIKDRIDYDLLAPTKLFDMVWYGKVVRGNMDLEEIKAALQKLRTAGAGS